MTIQQYIDKINTRYKLGNSTEHTFRGDLQTLLETLLPDIATTNEPTRIKCGAPDYILTTRKNEIPVGYIEAKDLGADLNHKSHQAQFKRYKDALNNLIITNYLDFQVFKDGALVAEYSIGAITGNTIQGKPEQFDAFTAQIKDFAIPTGQTIKSASKLAGMMAVKAKMLAEVIGAALISDEENEANSTLKDQLKAFKDILIHDIGAKEFADIYAQTIAYGMFAARLHDPTLPTFSRQEAAELIPKTNPFLRKLFQYVAGYDLDSRIVWIVDALADIFRATDVRAILNNFGKATQQTDPIIHFYETFLSEYDPKLRKARGVWYTPEPVVNFIVRAVDDILKTEFGLPDGIADTNKIKIKRTVETKATADMRSKLKKVEIEEAIHRVQILDPATGTGTFLAEVVKYIYNSKFEGQQGIWSNYVETHLMPRINGFELLMASYAMAHLKLELLLSETGYRPKSEQRLKVFLTNSLEEYHPYIGELPFAGAISDEANQANKIKKETPVMVVMGNPPYLGESKNKGKWIMGLMETYKKEPGGKEKLKERNPKWLNDDYVKFLRFGQFFIEKNGSGILAFINPHGFLDNPTFRGMRWNLLKAYDKIFVIDLHGNSNKQESSPDGSVDQNIFDILQGVSINIFIKTGDKNEADLARVFHFDVYGKREHKYQFLLGNDISKIPFDEVVTSFPNYYFIPKDFKSEKSYNNGFSCKEIFNKSVLGFQTHRDDFAIDFSKEETLRKIKELRTAEISDSDIYKRYSVKDNRDWRLSEQRHKLLLDKDWQSKLTNCSYRPFDIRSCYLSYVMMDYPRKEILQSLLNRENISLLISRQQATTGFHHCFIANIPPESCVISNKTKEQNVVFSLYSYEEEELYNSANRIPNLNEKIICEIALSLELSYTNEKEQTANTFAPIDVLDYIYAVLHSPAYREQYKEFLKIDFPRVPYPKDVVTFWALVALGGQIRQLHLLDAPTVSKYITKYPIDGNNEVTKPAYKDGRVYINDTQYFEGVPPVAWEFYIGGYQPAQKWLKDRKERTLDFDDILHYQKMIVALTETDRLMKEIDKIDFM